MNFRALVILLLIASCVSKNEKLYEVVDLDTNGDTIKITTIKGDLKHGPLFRFDSSNRRSIAEIYKNDTLVKKVYYLPNRSVTSEGPIVENQPHGLWINYYEDGSVLSRINMKNGQPSGEITQYHRNGKLEMKGEDASGNGTFEMYDTLGNLRWKGVLENGQAVDTLFYSK